MYKCNLDVNGHRCQGLKLKEKKNTYTNNSIIILNLLPSFEVVSD